MVLAAGRYQRGRQLGRPRFLLMPPTGDDYVLELAAATSATMIR
jgi:hypothetical protein